MASKVSTHSNKNNCNVTTSVNIFWNGLHFFVCQKMDASIQQIIIIIICIHKTGCSTWENFLLLETNKIKTQHLFYNQLKKIENLFNPLWPELFFPSIIDRLLSSVYRLIDAALVCNFFPRSLLILKSKFCQTELIRSLRSQWVNPLLHNVYNSVRMAKISVLR